MILPVEVEFFTLTSSEAWCISSTGQHIETNESINDVNLNQGIIDTIITTTH